MPITLYPLCYSILLNMFFAAVLSMAAGVDGCWWTVSDRVFLMDVAF